MNIFEVNKFMGAGVGALLAFLLLGFFSEAVFHQEPLEKLAYSVSVETGDAAPAEVEEGPSLGELFAAADLAKGEKTFKKCAACHKAVAGANGVGPSLYGVVGRPSNAIEGFGYSGALADAAPQWDAESLFHFLENPKGYAPGTSMGFKGLKKPADRANVIAWLNQQSDAPAELPAP